MEIPSEDRELAQRELREARSALGRPDRNRDGTGGEAVADDQDEGVFTPTEMAYQMSLAAHRETLERMVAERDETIARLRTENAALRAELSRLAEAAVRALGGDPAPRDS